jgi:hypothetical protein
MAALAAAALSEEAGSTSRVAGMVWVVAATAGAEAGAEAGAGVEAEAEKGGGAG